MTSDTSLNTVTIQKTSIVIRWEKIVILITTAAYIAFLIFIVLSFANRDIYNGKCMIQSSGMDAKTFVSYFMASVAASGTVIFISIIVGCANKSINVLTGSLVFLSLGHYTLFGIISLPEFSSDIWKQNKECLISTGDTLAWIIACLSHFALGILVVISFILAGIAYCFVPFIKSVSPIEIVKVEQDIELN